MPVKPKIMAIVREILEQFGTTYVTDSGKLKKLKVIQDLDNYKPLLIEKLLNNKDIRSSYVETISNTDVFKLNQFIEMFEYKEYWDDSYTKFINKIGLTVDNKFIDENADVVLDFPFKDTILKAGMKKEDTASSNEPFLHEILAKKEIDELLEPKIFINTTKYDSQGVQEVKTINSEDNLVIKGNNLIALHSLKSRYHGAVKLIYLDVPYNTGNDSFVYNDRYSHSAWLTFIKNRLEIAKDLLNDQGVLFISIDRNEFAELKVLLDEIFNKQYEGTIINVSTPNGRDYGNFAQVHDYIHVYSKDSSLVTLIALDVDKTKFKQSDSRGQYYLHPLFNSNSSFNNINRPNLFYPFYIGNITDTGFYEVTTSPDEKHQIEVYPPKSKTDGTQFVWRWGKEKAQREKYDLVGQQKSDGSYRIAQKMRPKKQISRTLWNDSQFSNRRGTEELQKLFDGKVFSFPKPEHLMKRIIEIGSNEMI